MAAPAIAQEKPAARPAAAPAKPAAPSTVGEITVTGTPPPVRVDIDRKSYSVAGDLQATSGSIGDALRNIPSVDVDVSGNVSLRGDANVTIMIDGKPSGMFRGEGKAQALQSLGADRIERVEVITNPSAAFSPDGAAGIINLITKKTAKVGSTGSMRANWGSMGRSNVGASGTYKAGKVTLSGDAGYRRDVLKQHFTDTRSTLDTVNGGFRNSFQDTATGGKVDIYTARAGLDYDPDAKTRISAELRVQDFGIGIDAYNRFDETSGLGVPSRAYDRIGRIDQNRSNIEGSLSYRKKYGQDHELYVSLGRERTHEDSDRPAATHLRLPIMGDAFEDITSDGLFWRTTAKIDYSQPLPGGVKLKLGYAFEGDDNDYDARGFRGATAGSLTPDATLTNLFRFDQQVHAVYATYERPLGKKLTALAGLRLETVQIDLNQVTQALKAENDYTRLYPSLHLSYVLSEARQLTASYAHRIQRPQPQEFNPFRAYSDPQNFRAGNPNLKPQQTDSFELGYQYRKRGTIYLATLYYRDVSDAANDVTRDIGGGVFLTTRENIGHSQSAGLELVANGRITRKLTYNVSGNAYWSQIDGAGLGFGSQQRDAATLSGRGNLNWQMTTKDFLQMNGFLNGKRLTPQGYAEPFGMLNLGYRHKFNEKLSGVVTVQDALGTFRDRRVIDTPTFKDVVRAEPHARGVFVGFTYAFGGRQRDPGFDFGQGGAPGN